MPEKRRAVSLRRLKQRLREWEQEALTNAYGFADAAPMICAQLRADITKLEEEDR